MLALYDFLIRVRNKGFSILVSRSFHEFGQGSVIHLPFTGSGSDRIAIGAGVMVGPGSQLEALPGGRIAIGNGARLNGRVTIAAAENVAIGRDVLFARGVYVSDHNHARRDGDLPIRLQGVDDVAAVRIGDGAWLGQNAVVLPGVTIGRGAVVGANSVVNRDVPPRGVAVGSPARLVGSADDAGRVPRPIPSHG